MAVAGCSGGATPVTPEPPSTGADLGTESTSEETGVVIELRFDQTTEAEDLELRWLELEDSRCPIGVTCVWAGQTVVTVEIARGEGEVAKLELLRRAGREPEMSRAFGYELRLLEVDPHPKEGHAPERSDYVARLELAAR